MLTCLTAMSSPVSLSMATNTLPNAPCPTSSPFVQLMGLRCWCGALLPGAAAMLPLPSEGIPGLRGELSAAEGARRAGGQVQGVTGTAGSSLLSNMHAAASCRCAHAPSPRTTQSRILLNALKLQRRRGWLVVHEPKRRLLIARRRFQTHIRLQGWLAATTG